MIARELWPQGMVEGKHLADELLAINKRIGKYMRLKDPKNSVTDRELTLAAAVQCYYQFKLATDQAEAARVMIWNKVETFIEKELKPGDRWAKQLLKQVRRARNKDQLASGFLAMWGEIEAFLAVATTEDFWKNNSTTPPWEIVSCLKRDIEALVTGDKHVEQGQEGTARVSDRADGAAEAGEAGPGGDAGHGAGSGGGGAGEGERHLEAPQGRAQEEDQRPGNGAPAFE